MLYPEISDSKIMHMRSVAELMYERAYEISGNKEYAEDMYALGLLHDIGYIFGSDEHGANGADLMCRNGYEYENEIRYHGKVDVPEECLTDELLLLQWCDMSVLPGGAKVTCDERLEDIGNRYGFDSNTYKSCQMVCARLADCGLI